MQTFAAPSFDDKILEVVAVFGSMQMAVSRVIKLQHHRIAQVLASVLEAGGIWPRSMLLRQVGICVQSRLPVQSPFSSAVFDL